jgi:16S rRNA (guanine527-N7)-methyltransferase
VTLVEKWPERAAPLADLGARFSLSPAQVDLLRAFGATLAFDELAPTTVREPLRVRDDHIADALVALDLEQVSNAAVIADLGSGAGVPGVPLAIALPQARVILLEGNGRKCAFLGRVASGLPVVNVEVLHGRAETWSAGIGACDLVTARALAPLDVVAEYAAPLLRLGGALVAWRGRREHSAETEALRAAEILGLSVAEPLPVEPYPGSEHRHLHTFVKVSDTPSRFPRRDGVARKRPLGRA